MPILDQQRQIREVGRIRLGLQVERSDGNGMRPKKLNRFRFTSRDRRVIESAAGLYGGTVEEWTNRDHPEWQVITNASEVPIILPPDPEVMAFSQWRESWVASGCVKRCDGEYDHKRDVPCDCDPDNRECKSTTRLKVILPEVKGLGVWRLESHGYYAATELAGAVYMVSALAGVHSLVPARLRLDMRRERRLVNGKAEVIDYVVPAIDLDVSVNQVQALVAGGATPVALPAVEGNEPELPPAEPGWKPVPPLAAPAAPSLGEQLDALAAPPAPRKGRRQAPLPSTGRRPRTAAERAAAGATPHGTAPSLDATAACLRCGRPYGSELVERDRQLGGYVHKTCPTTEAIPTDSVGNLEVSHQEGGKPKADDDEVIDAEILDDEGEDPAASQGQDGGGEE